MTRREQAYNRKLASLISKCGKLEDNEVKKVLRLLDTARKDVAATIASTEWETYMIPQMKEAVDQAINGFKGAYLASQDDALLNLWNAGIDVIDSPLHYAGISITAPQISRTALEIMQGYSADLITNLSADALKKINGEIAMGVMGRQTPFEVMKAIGRNLTDKSIFTSIGHRAEVITRTELARINSNARKARMDAVVGNTEPKMHFMKKWLGSGKANPRDTHAVNDGVAVEMDDDFPGGIPYPHAPGLPADEVINCGCSHVMTSPDWDKLPKTWEPIDYHALAIYD